MDAFSYDRAQNPADALSRLRRVPRSLPIAGGTSLLDLMKLGIETPPHLVDVNQLLWSRIEERSPGTLHIGALVRNSELAQHPLLKARAPVVSEALLSGASPQIRNMATVGGNLLQRTRCPYFRDLQSPCNKRLLGSGCAARQGHSRESAILGGSETCIAVHPSDLAVALLVLDAVVHILPQDGASERTVPLSEFHLLPGKTPARETVLEPQDLISGVSVTLPTETSRSCYLKVTDRALFEFALASVAVCLEVKAGVIQRARLALGGVATKPWRALAAERALEQQKPSLEVFRTAAELALREAEPVRENAFKVELSKRCIVRALQQATDPAPAGGAHPATGVAP